MSTSESDAMVSPADAAGTWEQAAWRIGVEVAAPASDDVDRNARFPKESLDALRSAGLLAALLPESVGGGGATLPEIVGAVRGLAVHCASSALMLAMHSIEVVNLARHGTTDGMAAIAREVAAQNLLIANANSEVGVGGDVSRSICALDTSGTPWTLDKQALAVSFGEGADLVVASARRDAEAAESDQVLVVCRRASLTMEPISDWDTLGLRGTCSRGYALHAELDADCVFPVSFATVANDGGGQARQLLLSAVWVGLAEAAAARAHEFVRAAARKSIGTTPPSALRLAEIAADLQSSRSLLASLSSRFEWLDASGDLENAGYTMALRTLKVSASTLAVRSATAALSICGIMGYKRDTPFSMDRIIRDAHGGLIMVSNDRHLGENAQLLLARRHV